MKEERQESAGRLPLDYTQVTMTTYTSDVSGVASALYELGGMTVIHDASGCNSTYSTHDEPRWETMNSAVYVSALNEMDAVLGNESILAENLVDAAERLQPAFGVLAGTIIPMMTGSDLKGIASEVEDRTGVPFFALSTNGMRAYSIGAAQGWIELARRFVKPARAVDPLAVNILGATPLDFSICGEIERIRLLLAAAGIRINACWAMGSNLAELSRTREAALNLVVSSAGLPLAQVFARHFGMPFLGGLPVGEAGAQAWVKRVIAALDALAGSTESEDEQKDRPEGILDLAGIVGRAPEAIDPALALEADVIVVHEPLRAAELALAIKRDLGLKALAASALPALGVGDGRRGVRVLPELAESDFDAIFRAAAASGRRTVLLADPLFFAGAKRSGLARTVPLPHEAASGRIWRKETPDIFEPDGWRSVCEAIVWARAEV